MAKKSWETAHVINVIILLITRNRIKALRLAKIEFTNASAPMRFISDHILYVESCSFRCILYYQHSKFRPCFMKHPVDKFRMEIGPRTTVHLYVYNVIRFDVMFIPNKLFTYLDRRMHGSVRGPSRHP